MDRRRILWPEGSPEKAVVTRGLLDRWWTEFRMGWSLNPKNLRRVHSAWGNPLDCVDWENPRAVAEHWEAVLFDRRPA